LALGGRLISHASVSSLSSRSVGKCIGGGGEGAHVAATVLSVKLAGNVVGRGGAAVEGGGAGGLVLEITFALLVDNIRANVDV
jgi:hypothetical protein